MLKQDFLQAECRSCHLINSVKALEGEHWKGVVGGFQFLKYINITAGTCHRFL